mgnify:CR=1 FL=1
MEDNVTNFGYFDKPYFEGMYGHFVFPDGTKPQWESVSYLQKKNATIGFFKSMHPLLNFIQNNFKILSSGTGTITMSALDLAVQLGFKNIEILGADFGYINGKSYAKGTYLDTLYQKSSNKIEPSELIFDKLLFRTNLIKNESKLKQNFY